jgi:nitrogen fixation NifU-like protein
MTNMYQENIIDLYKHPKNKGMLESPTHEYSKNNPLCGDEISIQLIIEDNKIKDVKFLGEGCAISIASVSMLTDKIKRMDIEVINNLTKDDILEMLHIPISTARIKCALLSLETVKGALNSPPTKNNLH